MFDWARKATQCAGSWSGTKSVCSMCMMQMEIGFMLILPEQENNYGMSC